MWVLRSTKESSNPRPAIELRLGSGCLSMFDTFSTLFVALYREGKLERSEEIHKEMEMFKCKPNVFTYSILMAGFCDEGRIEEARKLWEEMVAKGTKPDVMAFNTLMGGYYELGEMERDEELFREMVLSETKPTGNTYKHLIKGHCCAAEVDSALLVYKDMRRGGFGTGASIVDEVLGVMCEKGRVAEGLGILRNEMRREEFCPSRKSSDKIFLEVLSNSLKIFLGWDS